MDATYPLRHDKDRMDLLAEIGRPYHMKKAALIRLAVDQLIAATAANGGQLPSAIEAMRDADNPEAAAVVAGSGQ